MIRAHFRASLLDFGNITHAIAFKRFSLRGKKEVNGQWQLITMLQHIFKVHRMAWQGA